MGSKLFNDGRLRRIRSWLKILLLLLNGGDGNCNACFIIKVVLKVLRVHPPDLFVIPSGHIVRDNVDSLLEGLVTPGFGQGCGKRQGAPCS